MTHRAQRLGLALGLLFGLLLWVGAPSRALGRPKRAQFGFLELGALYEGPLGPSLAQREQLQHAAGVAGALGLGKFVRMIPSPVMMGFVNGQLDPPSTLPNSEGRRTRLALLARFEFIRWASVSLQAGLGLSYSVLSNQHLSEDHRVECTPACEQTAGVALVTNYRAVGLRPVLGLQWAPLKMRGAFVLGGRLELFSDVAFWSAEPELQGDLSAGERGRLQPYLRAQGPSPTASFGVKLSVFFGFGKGL